MTDLTFRDRVLKVTPAMNERVMEGYICHEIVDMERQVDDLLRKAYDGLFEGRMRYLGFKVCTPQEQFEFSTRPKNTRRVYEMAESNLYLIRIRMEYLGQPLPDIYMYLPYVEPGGLIKIGGTQYHLVPVLADKVISVEQNHIFVRLYQFKMNFYEKFHTIVLNGSFDRPSVAFGDIYRQKSTKKRTSGVKSVLVNYLLAREGFSGMFQKYAGFTPVVGGEEITTDAYPEEEWVVVKTGCDRAKPPDYPFASYTPTKIRMAIPRHMWTTATRALVGGFYYIVDHFPERVQLEALDHLVTWKLILGIILFDSTLTPGRMVAMTDEHFESSDTYMDDISSQKLAERGYQVKTFTELLALVATHYQEFKQQGGDGESVYNRHLNTLQELLHPITQPIFHNKYNLLKEGSKGQFPAYNVVRDRFARRFKPGYIFGLVDRSKTLVAQPVSYSGDHMYLKITSALAQQKSVSTSNAGNGASSVMRVDHVLTTPQMMVGNLLFLSKGDPVPLSHINPYVCVDPNTGTTFENPKYTEELREIDRKLGMKS